MRIIERDQQQSDGAFVREHGTFRDLAEAHSLFRCNLRRIVDYEHLAGYTRELHQRPGIAATVDIGQIKAHYYRTHPSLNPARIIPDGPVSDFDAPHGRLQ